MLVFHVTAANLLISGVQIGDVTPTSQYKPVSSLVSRIDDEDGSEMLDAAAAAAAAGTRTDSDLHQPGCIITRQQNYPHRLSYVACTGRRSDQRRYRKSSERQPSAWI